MEKTQRKSRISSEVEDGIGERRWVDAGDLKDKKWECGGREQWAGERV